MKAESTPLGEALVTGLEQWVLCAVLGMALAAPALAIVIGAFWMALCCVSWIVPFVDEHGNRLSGSAALRHAHYRLKVWLGHVSFFPYMSDQRWRRPLRFHFILMSLIGFGEVFGVLLNEGERPLYLSMLSFFLPSLLLHAGGIFSRKGAAAVGMDKHRGPGKVTSRRFFTDEEIAKRKESEVRQKEATRRFWERQGER